ncbi:MAG: hypothetical protein ACFCVK_00400 [Acidimicrobiales bacterium]
MSLLMEPGRALLVMAVVAFLLRFVAGAVPLIGGLLVVILWFAVVFGLVGGVYLTVMARRRPA